MAMAGEHHAPVRLVWNKGIAAGCDHRFPDEFPSGAYSPAGTMAGALAHRRLPSNLISGPAASVDIADADLVWVRLSWLRSFVSQVLPRVRRRFVLVTGDSDSSVPSEVLPEARAILASGKVSHWWAQNYDGALADECLFSPVPIGIDFHMLSERAMWGEQISSPGQQEQALLSIRAALPPLVERIPKIYVDFAWQSSTGMRSLLRSLLGRPTYEARHLVGAKCRQTRQELLELLRGSGLLFCQETALPRTELWRRRGQFAFVLSPHGIGLDCHRTWEALALGHIVIVPSSSLDPLYCGLPVVAVNDWAQITSENLAKWQSLWAGRNLDCEQLTNHYWNERIRASASGRGC